MGRSLLQVGALVASLLFCGCLPMYHHDTSPEVFSALPRDLRATEKKVAVIMITRQQSSSAPLPDDNRTVGEPLITTTKDLRENFRHIRTNSLQFRSPVGVLFGKRQSIEELCLLAEDGGVVSLRRAPGEKGLSNDWREKSFGKLIEPGRQYLLAVLADSAKDVSIPPEVLSACSFGERKAPIHWSEIAREDLRQFLSEMKPISAQ